MQKNNTSSNNIVYITLLRQIDMFGGVPVEIHYAYSRSMMTQLVFIQPSKGNAQSHIMFYYCCPPSRINMALASILKNNIMHLCLNNATQFMMFLYNNTCSSNYGSLPNCQLAMALVTYLPSYPPQEIGR